MKLTVHDPEGRAHTDRLPEHGRAYAVLEEALELIVDDGRHQAHYTVDACFVLFASSLFEFKSTGKHRWLNGSISSYR